MMKGTIDIKSVSKLKTCVFRRDEILEKRAEVQATYGKLTTSRGTDFENDAHPSSSLPLVIWSGQKDTNRATRE